MIIEVEQIGNLRESPTRDNPQAGRLYSAEGLSPTLNTMEDGMRQPLIAISTNGTEISGTIRATYFKNGERNIEENIMHGLGYEGVVEQVGYLENGTGQHQSNTVYSTDGPSPALTTITGGGTQQIKILEEPVAVASRGRNPDNPSDRTVGTPTEQRLEVNETGVSNCLTSVAKDSMVLEPSEINYQIPEMNNFNQRATVNDGSGLCRTITGQGHSGNEPKVLVGIKQATKQGFIECEVGGVADFSYPTSTKRRGRVQGKGQISPTLTGSPGICKIEKVGQISNDGSQYGTVVGENGLSSTLSAGTHGYANSCIQTGYRIRKLTAHECFRLMGMSDDDFDKAAAVNSATQLYKEAGNAIVVNVLMAIFGQMFEGKERSYRYETQS